MKPYGQRPPRPSTPTWTAPNNRTGRARERDAVRQEAAGEPVCTHGRSGHCCACEDCARFEREPDWCGRCGAKQLGIGWNNVCITCQREMWNEE